MAAKKPPPVNFLSIWNDIDTEAVEREIAPVGLVLADFDLEHAKACVYAAAERWLPWDLENLKLDKVEAREEVPVCGEAPIKCFLDLSGKVADEAPWPAFKEYRGQPIVLDWKSARSPLDTRWKERLLNSWQWKIYATAIGAKLVIYRGVRRPQHPGEDPETKEIIIDVPSTTEIEVHEQALGVIGMRAELVEQDLEVWPRHMPFACNAFGRECPYFQDCSNYTMPRETPPPKQLSYSSMDDFLLCPERHRRNVLQESGGEGDTSDTVFGNCVHRGLAEVWRQAFKIPKEENDRR